MRSQQPYEKGAGGQWLYQLLGTPNSHGELTLTAKDGLSFLCIQTKYYFFLVLDLVALLLELQVDNLV